MVKIFESKPFLVLIEKYEYEEQSKSKKLWVPIFLTAEHKGKRFTSSLDFLIRSEKEGDGMLKRIVTGDETWVFHITLESKQQSMEWQHTSPSVKVKSKQMLSRRKIMAKMFWN
ncbi:uncharacterized protein TNCT_444581 [Trichonephila clavata]|uniref:Uncharacterized protein n=1 Tax=Trichonephila clavata TaxID=2740835 RepID=A0A8X6LB76_TRICU|nr:uncharacterized protein TNCT_444581 [Trichonephila clavata]